MYYEEKIIDGVLHSRNDPRGSWTPFTAKALTIAYIAQKTQCEKAEETVESLEKHLNRLKDIIMCA